LLQYERTSIGGIGGGTQQSVKIEDVAKDYVGAEDGRIADPAVRARVIAHRINDRSFGLTMRRALEESQSGRAPGAASSMFKYYGTEQNIRRYELLLSIMGTRAIGWDVATVDDDELATTRAWLRSKGNSIEGGTSEVQLNVIAKRVLGLPD
jgi:alkylation response protein AidB-like acyl-CoA dehydrogenase